MILIIHSHGDGWSRAAVNYLVGLFGTVNRKMPKEAEMAEGVGLRSVAPVVLRGDVEATSALIDSLDFARKYTSGVLSFEEEDLPMSSKIKTMDDFENAVFPGFDANQYDCLWVEHRDKGRLELNFLIPNVELTTGRRLQPYFDRADRKRMDAFQTIINCELGLSDLHCPGKRQKLTRSRNLPKKELGLADSITKYLIEMHPKNREEVVELLTKKKYKIVRKTDKSISIKNPNGKRNIRLRGVIYEKNIQK
ncbi:MAG: relaxase/mobilization nuclease domain-containing protein [Halopseudomonas sp.]